MQIPSTAVKIASERADARPMWNHTRATSLAAMPALVLPLALLASAPTATAATSTTSYLTSSTSTLLPTAKALAGSAPGQAKPVTNQIRTATGWVELWSQGSSGQPTSGSQPAPSGRGYLLPQTDGTTTPAGNWVPTITLGGTGRPTIVPTVRMYKRSTAGVYTLIAAGTGPRIRLSATAATVALPAVPAPAISWAAGDQLYLDLVARVVRAASSSTGGIVHYDDGGAAQSVTHPTPVTTTTPTSGEVWRPAPGTSWQIQHTGIVDTTLPVAMYDIDLFDAQPAASTYTVPGFGTVSVPKGDNAGVIDTLHAAGRTVICYLDTGAWESYRPDASLFPTTVLGNSTGWAGERWLDIRAVSWPSFDPLIAARMDLAVRSRCDGVAPDQNGRWGYTSGFPLTIADQTTWYLHVAEMAHSRGLSVGMYNGIESIDAGTVAAFDWALNEQCMQYDECAVYDPFIAAGKAVFQVEYTDEGMTYEKTCPADNAANFDGLLKTLDLDSWRQPCR